MSASRPSAAAPATHLSPSASVPGAAGTGTEAPTAPSTAAGSGPASQTKRQRWAKGLASLQRHMTNAMGSGPAAVTSAELRSQARKLSRCPAELAGLGPPSAGLRSEYRQARQACAGFEQGARCDLAAARILNPNGTGPQARLTRLFRCSDAGINRGSELISVAALDASFPG